MSNKILRGQSCWYSYPSESHVYSTSYYPNYGHVRLGGFRILIKTKN